MPSPSERMTGEGVIKQVFTIAGRGFVLMLERGWSGTIHRGGVVRSGLGEALIGGPEYVRTDGGEYVAIMVDPTTSDFFPVGESIRFFFEG
ncbi:MAG: hypothetical protein KIT43_05895 [Bauldia sp.]|nr:hypothetical protein [Bauldia sp.]